MTYREALKRRYEHAHVYLPAELEVGLSSAYATSSWAFSEGLTDEMQERAEVAAAEGRSVLYITALLISLMIGFRASRAERSASVRAAIEPVYQYGFNAGALMQLNSWRQGGDGFNLTDAALLAVIGQAAEFMAIQAVTTFEIDMADEAARSVIAGLTAQDIRDRITDELDGDEPDEPDEPTAADDKRFARLKQRRIDLTGDVALARGENEGRLTVAQRSVMGDYEKVWRHGPAGAGEQRRPSHRALEGARVPRYGMFSVDGVQVRHPHDWDRAGAEQWASCHCFCYYAPAKGVPVVPWRGD